MYSTRNRGGWGGVSNGMFLMMRCCEEKNINPNIFDGVLKKLKNRAYNAYYECFYDNFNDNENCNPFYFNLGLYV